jgi:hypothetical protein
MKDKMHKIIKCVQLPPAVARNSSKLILLSPPCIIKVHYIEETRTKNPGKIYTSFLLGQKKMREGDCLLAK